jgi:hypothetical protein
MTGSQTVGVIGHALFTNKQDPFNGPLIEMKTRNKDLLINEVFSFMKCGQYPSHLFHNIGPVVLNSRSPSRARTQI